MGLWGTLRKMMARARADAVKEGGRVAARSVVDGVANTAESLLEDTVSEVEHRLRQAEQARGDRPDVRPDEREAEALALRIERAAASVDAVGSAQRERQRTEQQHAARQELERMQAELRDRRGGS